MEVDNFIETLKKTCGVIPVCHHTEILQFFKEFSQLLHLASSHPQPASMTVQGKWQKQPKSKLSRIQDLTITTTVAQNNGLDSEVTSTYCNSLRVARLEIPVPYYLSSKQLLKVHKVLKMNTGRFK